MKLMVFIRVSIPYRYKQNCTIVRTYYMVRRVSIPYRYKQNYSLNINLANSLSCFNPLQVQTKLINCVTYDDIRYWGFNPLQVQTKPYHTQVLGMCLSSVSIPYRYKQNHLYWQLLQGRYYCFNPLQVQTKHAKQRFGNS